jgi:transposase
MSNETGWKTRAELEHQIVRLLHRGFSQRQIARAIGVTRGLVKRVMEDRSRAATTAHTALPPVPAPATPRPSKLDAHEERIKELLAQFPAITAQRVFEELRAAGYEGRYSIVKERVRRLRPPKPPEPSRVRPVFGPGEMGEQDWSPHRVEFSDGVRPVHAFMLSLSHSRSRYPDFFDGEDMFALLEGHRRTFEYFGGVPHQIRYDRQKAVVARCEGPDVIYQPRLLAFATHYGFSPQAVRPRKPNDKAFVERDLWDLERSFLCGRRFRDLEDMRVQARRWLAEVVELRYHPKLRRRRIVEIFADEERAALRPLPTHPFDTARVVYRLCSIDGFVSWQGNRYSVPYEHVTALVPVRITQDELFVYGPGLACLAHHGLLPRGVGQDSVIASHRPPRGDGPGASLDVIRERFLALGEQAGEFLGGLLQTHPRSAAYHARRILELRERYAAPDVAAAMVHALMFRAFSAHAVARIVEVRARPRTLDEYVAAETEGKLRGLLSAERLVPRDLRSYDVESPPVAAAELPPPACPPTSPETSEPAQEPPCPTDNCPSPSQDQDPSKPR